MKTYQDLFKEYSFQDLATQILFSSINKNQLAPAYLFTGPTGVGQKEIALRFLEGISSKKPSKKNTRRLLESGNHPDLYTIEPTYLHQGKLISKSLARSQNFESTIRAQIRLEQIKDLKKFLIKKPIESELSMVLIEDIDSINEAASNALLKTIEEPSNGLLILISSKPERLLETIKSRCQIIPFKPYNLEMLKKNIMENQSLAHLVNSDIEDLVYLSNGSPELLKSNLESLSVVPEKIWPKIKNLEDQNELGALSLAKEITENLNFEEQLVLINWMQQYYWRKKQDSKILKKLDTLRLQIKSYINPRIAWEVSLNIIILIK